MYAPHTVTVYNIFNPRGAGIQAVYITILRGVLLDISQGSNIMKSGLEKADKATLYIPFSVHAVNAVTGQKQQYLPPKEYEQAEDKARVWTIGKHGKSSANNCFFVKGEVVELEEAKYSEFNERFDYCYLVSTVDVRDFGARDMQHWQVGGN